MELRDARTIGPEELEDRRRQAIMLHRQKMLRIDIANVVGVHRNVVGQWIKAWREGGEEALKAKKAGRPKNSGRRLSDEQCAAIVRLITDKNPDQLKFPFALWTREAVRRLIRERFGIDLPIRTVGEYLKRWGFTVQKPVARAYERNEKAVRRWLDEEYPKIKEQAAHEKAEIHWGDETGLRSDAASCRGYAPRGRTPVMRRKGTPERVNMISTVTNQGKVRFMFYRGSLNARLFIDFVKRVIKDRRLGGKRPGKGRVYLIVDNHPVHRSYKVREWLEAHEDEVVMFFLPSYSPDLNPDEHLNCDLKDGVGRRPDSREKGGLMKNALSHMRSIQKQPARVRKYFGAKTVRYAA